MQHSDAIMGAGLQEATEGKHLSGMEARPHFMQQYNLCLANNPKVLTPLHGMRIDTVLRKSFELKSEGLEVAISDHRAALCVSIKASFVMHPGASIWLGAQK